MLHTAARDLTGRDGSADAGFAAPRPLRFALARVGAGAIARARRRLAGRHGGCWTPLDHVVGAFRAGYLAGSREPSIERLVSRISDLTLHDQGFAYEGAAMAVTLLDALTPWRKSRLSSMLSCAPGQRYLLLVGAGWAHAQLRRTGARHRARFDPLLRWLVIDGIGFHDGFMRALPSAQPTYRRARISGYARRAYDQGFGRSLWFTAAADPAAIAGAIDGASPERRPDLWSGVGLACAYAGALDRSGIDALVVASGRWVTHMGQGVAFAAEAHVSATGCVPPHSELASQAICGISAEASARIARDTSRQLTGTNGDGEPEYEEWRMRIRAALGA